MNRESWTIASALILLLLASARPTIELPHATYEYLVVFDISQSMNVEDYQWNGAPVSRLAYARKAAREAVRHLPCGSRVGWGAFAEYRTIVLLTPVEVCNNYDDLLAVLDNIDQPMRWANASEVSKGLYSALRAAGEIPTRPDVIFLSDGHEAPVLTPLNAPPVPDDLRQGAVRGWLVGTGGLSPQRIPKTDEEGARIGYWGAHEVIQLSGVDADGRSTRSSEHLSALREAHLQALAGALGLGYARLGELDSLGELMRDAHYARSGKAPFDLYWIPVVVALGLLAWHFRPDIPRRGR